MKRTALIGTLAAALGLAAQANAGGFSLRVGLPHLSVEVGVPAPVCVKPVRVAVHPPVICVRPPAVHLPPPPACITPRAETRRHRHGRIAAGVALPPLPPLPSLPPLPALPPLPGLPR
jgi:hypothetical protein